MGIKTNSANILTYELNVNSLTYSILKHMDIRLCDWSLEKTTNDDIQRVYHYQGYKVWLHTIYQHGDHAAVYLYNVITPKGELLENVGLYAINQMIFGKDYNENLLF